MTVLNNLSIIILRDNIRMSKPNELMSYVRPLSYFMFFGIILKASLHFR